jgi:hypothetical protein
MQNKIIEFLKKENRWVSKNVIIYGLLKPDENEETKRVEVTRALLKLVIFKQIKAKMCGFISKYKIINKKL